MIYLLKPASPMINTPLCLIPYIMDTFQIEIYPKSRAASSLKGKTLKLTYTKALKIHVESLK